MTPKNIHVSLGADDTQENVAPLKDMHRKLAIFLTVSGYTQGNVT
jgi:hypothetical protein